MLRRLLLGLVLALAACAAEAPAAPELNEPPRNTREFVQEAAEVLAQPAAAVAVEVAEVLPVAPAAPAPLLTPEGEALIIRWEVSNRARYERFLAGVICPGGASGPTWGIGYDGGHQTAGVIARDWQDHPQVDRLVPSAGVTGESRCKSFLATVVGVHTTYEAALHVFREVSIPAYYRLARRAFGPLFDLLPPNAKAALVSLVYNRGGSMANVDTRREMRVIKFDCLPAGPDLACIAGQLRAMCRIWDGTPNGRGLCNRRHDEARLVLLL